jgi:SAM-dependent methyltransferase
LDVAPEDEYGPSTYGDRIADVYDRWFDLPADTDQAVAALAVLSGTGPVLELGIGTGRIALPLRERGIDVHGVDASEAMVSKLRGKPGGAEIPIAMGDFADVGELVDGTYSMVYVPFNTFFGLLTQDDQVRCFQGVANVLADDGVFVIQAFLPDPGRFDRGQRFQTTRIEPEGVHLEASRFDLATLRTDTQHVFLEDGHVIRMFPVKIRFAWPGELDLMARLAGMRLRERWGGWQEEPFTSASLNHVSIYEKPSP